MGSVVEAGEHRGNHIHDDRLHPPLPKRHGRENPCPWRFSLHAGRPPKGMPIRPGPRRALTALLALPKACQASHARTGQDHQGEADGRCHQVPEHERRLEAVVKAAWKET